MVALRELVALPALRAGQPSDLSDAALSVSVRWVHVSDHPDVASALHGGELLLTHGLGIGPSQEDQQLWIDSLVTAGIAAIGIRLDHAYASLPETIAESCRVASIPLFSLHHRLDFATVLFECHSLILDDHSDRVRAALAVGQAASEVAMSGRGVQHVLDRLASDLDQLVVLEDSSRRIVGFGGLPTHGAAIFRDWDSHSHAVHTTDGVFDFRDQFGMHCLHADLVVRGMKWGRLHLINPSAPLDAELLIAVRQCALAIVASLVQRHQFEGLAAGIQGDLLSDILDGRVSPSEAMRHAQALGIDLTSDVRVLTIDYEALVNEQQELDSIRQAMSARGIGGLIAGNGRNRITALLAFPTPEVMSEFVGALGPASGGPAVPSRRIGVSGGHSLRNIGGAHDESRQALAAISLRDPIRIKHFPDIGVERVFADLAVGDQLATFVDLMIGPILAHDRSSSRKLLPILEEYLAAGGSKADAARILYISRRLLYARLEEIESLIGKPIEDVSVRVDLAVAVRAHRYIRSRRDIDAE